MYTIKLLLPDYFRAYWTLHNSIIPLINLLHHLLLLLIKFLLHHLLLLLIKFLLHLLLLRLLPKKDRLSLLLRHLLPPPAKKNPTP